MTTIERTRRLVPREEPRRRRPLAGLGLAVLALASVQIVFVVAPYLGSDPNRYFEEQRETYLRLDLDLRVHVLCGVLALLTGLAQLVGPLRRRFVRLHRALGVGYVASATVLSLSGLVLAPTAYTGLSTSLAFSLLALGTLYSTWAGLRMVLAGRYGEHRRWMIRSYSLVLAGVMLREYVGLYTGLHQAGLVTFSFETAYAAIAWLCWVPNLLVALWITRRSGERVPA